MASYVWFLKGKEGRKEERRRKQKVVGRRKREKASLLPDKRTEGRESRLTVYSVQSSFLPVHIHGSAGFLL